MRYKVVMKVCAKKGSVLQSLEDYGENASGMLLSTHPPSSVSSGGRAAVNEWHAFFKLTGLCFRFECIVLLWVGGSVPNPFSPMDRITHTHIISSTSETDESLVLSRFSREIRVSVSISVSKIDLFKSQSQSQSHILTRLSLSLNLNLTNTKSFLMMTLR